MRIHNLVPRLPATLALGAAFAFVPAAILAQSNTPQTAPPDSQTQAQTPAAQAPA